MLFRRVFTTINVSRLSGVTRLSTRAISEPEYMVTTNDEVDPKEIRIPFLKDVVKQEIYSKHFTNPTKWPITDLARHYGASKERIKAVILLMHERCVLMRSLGLEVMIEESGSIPRLKVKVPKVWQALYDKHIANAEEPLSKILADYNAEVTAEEDKASMNEEEVKVVVDKVKDHYRRLQNLRDYEEDIEDQLNDLRGSGVNTNFQEVPSPTANQRFLDSYHPKLLTDDELEDEKRYLLKKVKEDTSASVDQSLEQYEQKYLENKASVSKLGLRNNEAEKIRWKIAYKDLSLPQSPVKGPPRFSPTVIRTRSGEMRPANPVEEAFRSWNRRPEAIDVALASKLPYLAEKLHTPYYDMEKDDHVTEDIRKNKAEKVKNYKPPAKK